jgi:uncharacterized membrane protein YphA (DoxX/SURF4 family)
MTFHSSSSRKEDKAFALLRIVFGGVWLVDASFKWNPAFLNNFTNYVAGGAENQSALVQFWIHLWVQTVSVDPHLFAVIVAIAETAIAIGLLLGICTRIALLGGIAMTLVIWSTAEGFGGPYIAGSTDIGAAIIYALLFLALWLGKCWRHYSIDSALKKQIPVLNKLWY